MTYLFDTHTYIWFRGEPWRLPDRIMDLLTDTSQQGLISVVTPWEVAIKTGVGKFDGAKLLADLERRETATGFSILGISVTQAIASGLLTRHHGDPFDRLLVAQALDLNIPIVSRDRIFDRYGVQRIWD